MSTEMWTYAELVTAEPVDIEGFKVEATDGDIGKVDEATYEVGGSRIVVDTGPWIFGRKVMIPAGLVDLIDPDNTKVAVRLTKDQIKDSPEYDPDKTGYSDEDYRRELGTYYGSTV